MSEKFTEIREKMEKFGVAEAAIKAFERSFAQLDSDATGLISEGEIAPAEGVVDYEELPARPDFDAGLLARTVVIKLNGGLGTGMGLEKAKSLLEVKPGKTFLDLIARQILHLRETTGSPVRFLLMNSQATSADTLSYLAGKAAELGGADEVELLQNWAPKLRTEDLRPVTWEANPALEWCPPGHGDLYPALVASGWLERLLAEGVRYAFVSNSDNLGAVLDPTMLSYFAESGQPFLMEVTRRTEADKKGGHLATRRADGRLILREVAQCPDEDLGQFQDISKYRYFNTNNLWIDLQALQAVMDAAGGVMPLPVIRNRKTVDPRDSDSTPVVQLEVAMGAALESFEGAGAISVPRSRFAPVKSTSDLLALRSDAYVEAENGCLQLAPERQGQPPVVSLSGDYKLVDSLDRLGAPSLLAATKLEIQGDLELGSPLAIKGNVSFENTGSERASVPSGVYENETWTA
ncbi:MAG: UTP--glucose-1-phosphate uridylyltransferase [Verrucomicrobiales bacterium]